MKSTDRTILLILPVVAFIIGFWVLVIAPKQHKASDLDAQVAGLQTKLSDAQAQVAAGEAAKKDFDRNYSDVVSLGAAAPADDDQATLVYDMSKLGEKNNVSFRSFEVTQGATTAVAPTTTDATATESAVAALPLGATVGPAGLPVMPYDFNFFGDFFDVADFFGDIDNQVTVSDKKGPDVSGRLMTIDGFALTENPHKGFPAVQADFSVTTYIVPAEQGVDAGASPAGPGVVTPTAPDTTTVTSTPAPTAAVTP